MGKNGHARMSLVGVWFEFEGVPVALRWVALNTTVVNTINITNTLPILNKHTIKIRYSTGLGGKDFLTALLRGGVIAGYMCTPICPLNI